MWKIIKIKKPFSLFLLLLFFSTAYSQTDSFDSLSNELNRKSIYKKTESLEMLNKLYQMAYNHSDSSVRMARCLYEEAVLNYQQGITDSFFADKIEKRLERKNLPLQESALLQLALGTDKIATGNYSDAFTLHLQALEKFKEIGDERFMARVCNYLGSICYSIGLFNLSDYYYFEALRYITSEEYEYFSIKQNIYKNKLFIEGNETAVDSMICLLDVAEKENRAEILPIIYCNLASFLLPSDTEKAFFYITKIQTLEFDDPNVTAILYSIMAQYHFMNKEYYKALNCCRDAKKILEEINNLKNLSSLYGNMSMVFEELNKLDSALYYSIIQTKLIKKISSNSVALETHQKLITSYLETAQKDLTIIKQQNELKSRQFIFILSISAAVVLIILLFLLFVNQQKRRKASENRALTLHLEHEKEIKKKQEELLDVKAREITSYSLLVSNKNNLLLKIRELNAHIFDDKENMVNISKKIDEIILANLDVDEEWENFKMHFDKVHPHFFEKLKCLCHDLTEENLKMCAYIKIGMSNKQIAQLLNIKHTSVIVNHYCLKKKLKLPESENFKRFVEGL